MSGTGGFRLGTGLSDTPSGLQQSVGVQSRPGGLLLGNVSMQAGGSLQAAGNTHLQTTASGGGLRGLTTGLVRPQGTSGSLGLQLGQTQLQASSSNTTSSGGLTLPQGGIPGFQLQQGQAKKTGLTLGGISGTSSGAGVGITGSTSGATAIGLGSSLSGGGLKLGTGTSLTGGTGINLGSTATGGGGLKLGTGATLTSGLPVGSSVAGGGLRLGTGIGTTTSGLSQSSTLASGGLSIGIGATATGTAGLATSSGGGLGLGPVTTTASRGLGGVDPTQNSTGTLKTDRDGDSKAVLKQGMPDALNRLADDMSKFIKDQKGICEDICSYSEKPLRKVQDDVKSTSQILSLLAHTVSADSQAVLDLKHQSVQELKNAEFAQRTKDTPPGLQHENTLPAEYFRATVQSFDQQMQTYKQQIDDMENYMATLTGDTAISPQVLAEVIRKLHESFVALAGQIQSTHEAVKVQKDQYLNYRKAFLKDTKDVFEARRKAQSSAKRKVTSGPSPFGGMSGSAALAAVAAANAVAAPTMQPHLAATAAGGLHIGGVHAPGLQVGSTGGLSLKPTQSSLGAGSLGFPQGGSTGLNLGGTSSGLQLGSTGLGLTGGLQLGQGGLSGAQSAGATLAGQQQKPFQLQPVPLGKRGRNKEK